MTAGLHGGRRLVRDDLEVLDARAMARRRQRGEAIDLTTQLRGARARSAREDVDAACPEEATRRFGDAGDVLEHAAVHAGRDVDAAAAGLRGGMRGTCSLEERAAHLLVGEVGAALAFARGERRHEDRRAGAEPELTRAEEQRGGVDVRRVDVAERGADLRAWASGSMRAPSAYAPRFVAMTMAGAPPRTAYAPVRTSLPGAKTFMMRPLRRGARPRRASPR